MKFDRKKFLKELKTRGLKKGYIAERAGIHRSYLYMILEGLKEPSISVIKGLERALK